VTAVGPPLPDRRFGILTFGVAPYADLEHEWRWAEELGLDAAWITDTFAVPGLSDYEAWTTLAALARATTRLRIGTLITTVVARHPSLLASAALTVDHISNGRLELGIGAGDEPADSDVFGLPPWAAGERLERLDEYVRLLDRLLRGDSVASVGRYYPVTRASLVGPVQRPRPPIVVAAEGPRALRLAARHADGWCTLGGRPTTRGAHVSDDDAGAATRARVEHLERECRDAGRDPSAVRRVVLAFRAPVDPLSSLDAFDEFVGRYSELGMNEFVFYWPPPTVLRERQRPSAEQRARFEQIASSRFARPSS